MNITAEQTKRAQELILDRLNKHHQNQVSFQQVWAKPTTDMDDFPFLEVWAIYGGDPQGLDPGLMNSFGPYISEELTKIGIEAKPDISYVPVGEVELLGAPWTR